MNIPMKYEDVVAQLETERARVTDYIAQRAQTELKLEAALGREAALCKWQSEQSDKMDALREELGQCGSMAAMIEEKEWAEHAGSGPVSSRVESAFTQLHNELSEAQQRLTVAEQRNASITGKVSSCKDCGSSDLFWFAQNTVPNGIQHNRLNTHDVECVFFLGCNHCSATLKQVSADRIAEKITAALKPAAEGEGS